MRCRPHDAQIVDIAVGHARLTIAVLIFLLVAGALAYLNIPKESQPDVQIPYIYVQLSERGISPEDSERLLLRPMETALKTVANVKTMRSAAFEGGGYVLLEFDAGFNSDVAVQDVRAKVDSAKPTLPSDADEPGVFEVNLSLFPVISVALSGDLSERTMGKIARDLQNAIKEAPGVLSADLRGTRDEVVEIIAEPMLLKSYGVDLGQFALAASQGNSLVAAGALEGNQGSFSIKVPALIETPEDVLNIPVAASNAASVTLGDVATILPTFKDATSITRVNGKPAVVIDISKRSGANLIATVEAVKKVVEEAQKTLPPSVKIQYIGDQSKFIEDMLSDLQNSVTTAILLVVVVILFILGGRASNLHRHRPALRLPHRRARARPVRRDDEHHRAVLADPRGRHAGRRRHHCLRIRRTTNERRHEAEGGVLPRRLAHGWPRDRGDAHPHRGVLPAAALAGHRRAVHEVPAYHADRDAVGVAGRGAGVHTHARRAHRTAA